jgi:predicted dehydrogenase
VLGATLAALGTAEIVNSLEQVTDEIALAIIAAPNGLHFHLAREALMRGAHVLIEKPFVVRPTAKWCAVYGIVLTRALD